MELELNQAEKEEEKKLEEENLQKLRELEELTKKIEEDQFKQL